MSCQASEQTALEAGVGGERCGLSRPGNLAVREHHDAIGDTLVEQTDRVVCVLGQTLSVTPRKGDRLTID
jgi:hypothetical protein